MARITCRLTIGGSNGLRRCLASIVTRRVRFPRPPPIKDKCKHELVESTKLCIGSVNGSTTVSKTASGGSNPSRYAKFISHSVSGYATWFGARISKVRVLHARPILHCVGLLGRSLALQAKETGSIPVRSTSLGLFV